MTFKLVSILVFSLSAFCLGAPECGPDQCKDLWTAKKCNKVEHCIAGEWSKIEPTGNRDDVCEICLKMVKEARETLQSNETREELKEVLEGSCALLQLKPAVKLCDELVDELAQELIEVLSSRMDPEAVCSISKLCNNQEFWTAHKNSKDCVHCEAFAQVADRELESVSAEQFRNGVLSACRTAGSFSDACSQIGMELSGVLHGAAKRVLGNRPCEAVTLCPTNSRAEVTDSRLKIRVMREMCPLCKVVMKSVREKLLRVRSAEEFAEKMSAACEKMALSKNTCSVLSSPEFYEKLKSSEWLPNSFCSLTYCLEKPDEEVPIWPLLSSHAGAFKSGLDFDALELVENIEIFFPPVPEQKEIKAPRPTISYGDPLARPLFFSPSLNANEFSDCDTCNSVVDILSGRSDKGLESVCDEVRDADNCKRFVDDFAPILRKAISEGVLSRKICKDLMPSCQISEESSPESCSFCLNVMKVLKHGDSYFWGRALEDKCNELHKNSQEKCENLSSLFVSFPSLFKNSAKEIEACSLVKSCSPSAVQLYKSDDGGLKNGCQNCMLAVQSLEDYLKSNQSNKLIEELLDSICDLLPEDKRSKCEVLVEAIGVEGLKEIIQNFTPNEVCSKVHLCGSGTHETKVADVPKEVQISGGKTRCSICIMVMERLIDELRDNKTEEAIRKALDGLCKYFPEEVRDTCKNIINEYTSEEIIDMLLADFNATEICIYLKICPPYKQLDNSIRKEMPVFDIETNELRDWIEGDGEPLVEVFRPRIGLVVPEQPREEDFRRFRQIVQECALCEALVGVISRHRSMQRKDYDFVSNAPVICSFVPEDKIKECTSMVISYGPSIVNLIVDLNVDPNDVCVRIDLCDPDMQAKVNQPVSVSEDKMISKQGNECMLGPVFWCANAENAEKCGTFLHCQETVWKSWKSPPTRKPPQH